MRLNTPKRLSVSLKVDKNDLMRFVALVDICPLTGCWKWIGTKDTKGYGQFWWHGRMRWAGRFSIAAFKGDLPRGWHADHVDECRNKSCVTPFHLRGLEEAKHGLRHGGEGACSSIP